MASVFMVCPTCDEVMALSKLADHMRDAHQRTLKHVECAVCGTPVTDIPEHFRVQHRGQMPNVHVVEKT